MTTTRQHPPVIEQSTRDPSLDLVRVGCVLIVVAVHLLFIGVGLHELDGIVMNRPLEEQPWFWAASWLGQIMPLFFVVGGFASYTALRSARRRLADTRLAERVFIHQRMQRLIRPALPLLLVCVAALCAATALGTDPGLVDAVATGIGSPLWFLGAYLICQTVAPFLLRAHERAPFLTAGVLLAGVVLVDAAQFSLPGVPRDQAGMSLLGYLNLLFVWPLVHQFGFWYAEGAFARRRRWHLGLLAAGCWALLVPLTVWGPYSLDMLTNLNPPTLPLVLLGLGQAALLSLLKTPLTALVRTRCAQSAVSVLGTRLMTLYLWHLPVIIVIAGIGLMLPALSPAPGGAEWWWSRPLVYLAVLGLVLLVSLAVGGLEKSLPPDNPGSLPRLAVAGIAAVTPTVAITVLGLDLPLAVVAALGYGLARALLAQKPKSPKSPKSDDVSAEPDASAASAESSPHGRNALTSADATT